MLTRDIRRGAVSPVGSVGASKRLHCVEVSTGAPHPLALGFQ